MRVPVPPLLAENLTQVASMRYFYDFWHSCSEECRAEFMDQAAPSYQLLRERRLRLTQRNP